MKNSNQQNHSKSSGIGVIGLLGVAFVVLKLTGHIKWEWWLVTLPFWGGIALYVFILLIALVYFIIRNRKK